MQPDRVDPPRGETSPAQPRKRFEELIRARTERPARKGPPPPRRQRIPTPARAARADARAARVPGELRGQFRREMDTAARQRLADGQAATTQATGRLQSRKAELLRAALRTEEAERGGQAPRVSSSAPRVAAADIRDTQLAVPGVAATRGEAGATASASAPATEERVERALALVERIERFVRSGRPSLALTLRGGFPGRLEVQRVAPGAIALRLSSARAPSTAELGELRQALEARGLEVRTLEARRLTTSAEDACSPCP